MSPRPAPSPSHRNARGKSDEPGWSSVAVGVGVLAVAVVVAVVAVAALRTRIRDSASPDAHAPAIPQYLDEKIGATLQGHAFTLEVARTDLQRQRGLMRRPRLADDEGMLFVYPDRSPRGFWMRDTPEPLTLAYLADDGTILEIHDLVPLRETSVGSAQPVRLALEVRAGRLAEIGAKVGHRLVWDTNPIAASPAP